MFFFRHSSLFIVAILCFISNIASADKIFARSKSLNMSFTAIGTPWCQSNVNMKISANEIDKFDTPKFYSILNKLSHVLAQECHQANTISLQSQAINHYSIWRGRANRSDDWKTHRTGTRQLKQDDFGLKQTKKSSAGINNKDQKISMVIVATTPSTGTAKNNRQASEKSMDQLAGGWTGEMFGKLIEVVIWPNQIKSDLDWSSYRGYMHSPYHNCFMIFHLNYKKNETMVNFSYQLGSNKRARNCERSLLNKKDFRGEGEFALSSDKQVLNLDLYFLFFDDFKLKPPKRVEFSLKRNPVSPEMITFLETYQHNYIKKPSSSFVTFLKSGDIPKKTLKIDLLTPLDSPSGYYWIGKNFNQIRGRSGQFNVYNVTKTKYFKEDEITNRGSWDQKNQQIKYQTYAKVPNMKRCSSWSKSNWSYQFIPTIIDINGRQTIVYQEKDTFSKNKRPHRQCVHAGFDTFSCKRVRCNKWKSAPSGTYLVKSRKDAMDLYSQIKSR